MPAAAVSQDPAPEPVPCSVCGHPTAITPAVLAAHGCTTATHAKCAPRTPSGEKTLRKGEAHVAVEVIVGDERCDLTFEQAHADEAREEWEAGRVERDRVREQVRARMTWGERLDTALRELDAMSTVSARSPEHAAKTTGEDGDPGPPSIAAVDVSASTTVIGIHVRAIERVLDQERGLVRPAEGGRMTSDQKDKLIFDEYQGVRAEQVSESDRSLGRGPRAIMESRKREAEKRGLKVNLTTGVVTGKVVKGAWND